MARHTVALKKEVDGDGDGDGNGRYKLYINGSRVRVRRADSTHLHFCIAENSHCATLALNR